METVLLEGIQLDGTTESVLKLFLDPANGYGWLKIRSSPSGVENTMVFEKIRQPDTFAALRALELAILREGGRVDTTTDIDPEHRDWNEPGIVGCHTRRDFDTNIG